MASLSYQMLVKSRMHAFTVKRVCYKLIRHCIAHFVQVKVSLRRCLRK